MVMTWTARALEPEELAAVSANSKVVVDLLEDEPPSPKLAVDLDTAWHGIHWLLTGTHVTVIGCIASWRKPCGASDLRW